MGSVVSCLVGNNSRQASGGQPNKRGQWMVQDERLVDNAGQSGGKQHEAIWWWTTRQEEGGGGQDAGLSGGGQHSKRGAAT